MKLILPVFLLVSVVLSAAPVESRHYFRSKGALTGPSALAPTAVAEQFLKEAAPLHQLTENDLAGIYLVKQYRTAHNGVTHLVYRQRFGGVDVAYSDFVVNVAADGSIINAGGSLFPAPGADASQAQPQSLSPSIQAAMRWADPSGDSNYIPAEVQGKGQVRRFQRYDGKGDIEAVPVWYAVNGKLTAAWVFSLSDANGARHAAYIGAQDQVVLETRPLTYFQQQPPRGLVYTGTSPQPNPSPGMMQTTPPPYVPRTVVSFQGDPQASPAGWVEGTETAGNNVIAGRNPLAELLVRPVTARSPARDFEFPLELGMNAPNPTNYADAAITNLFYWMNRSHDLFWQIGFNEAAGNFQQQNFGKGGVGGDPIYAYAQFGIQQIFGASLNNAFFTALGLEDGSPSMIAMFLSTTPFGFFTDGSLDSEVMIHEYTHGVSNRLVRNLAGHHGGSMGEAWSDFFSLEFLLPQGAPLDGRYGVGNYFSQSVDVGARTRPYSTDMSVNPITFADLGRVAQSPQIHQDAGIWVEALWEMRANLIRQFGETEGRRRTRLLVIDGMKLSVPTPTMIDARDAILLADRTSFAGESQQQIWQAFAKRGLGATAFVPGVNSTRATASFQSPSNTGILTFAEQSYVHGQPVRVILHDANLTGDVALIRTTSYEAGSDVQTIRLRRTGAFYTGTVPTSNSLPTSIEDGALSVVPSSIISAYYDDVNADGGPRQISASVPTQLTYVRLNRAPGFRTGGDTPLNLRATPGVFQVYDLPWEFPFYGRNYSSLRVYTNGLLAFDLPPASACSDAFALSQFTGIAPLYGSFRTNGIAQQNENVYVSRPSEDAITFRWAAETAAQPQFGVLPEPVNFSATLYRDGRIEFQYGSGNRSVSFPNTTSSSCAATPSIGISNGSSSLLAQDYIGRANLENALTIAFDPPTGAGSVPEIAIESPKASDPERGVLVVSVVASDQNSPIAEMYVLVDGRFVGRAFVSSLRTDVCGSGPSRRPNCAGYSFSLAFEEYGIQPGNHTLKVIARNSRGGATEGTTPFRVEEGQSRTPLVRIESPTAGSVVTGTLNVRGIAAVPDLRIVTVDVLIDGVNYGVALRMARPEACTDLGFNSPDCPFVGFNLNINSVTGSVPLPDGEHRLQIRVLDETGRLTIYPENPITFRVNNGLNQAPTGVLSTPLDGQRVSGTIPIWGYAWDPDGTIETVELLVDGIIRGTLPYGDPRPGECPAIGNPRPCPNIGFWYDFNTKTLLNGPHVLGIRLIDDRGRATVIPQFSRSGLTIIVGN